MFYVFWVLIVLLVLVLGIGVGMIFGYSILKKDYDKVKRESDWNKVQGDVHREKYTELLRKATVTVKE